MGMVSVYDQLETYGKIRVISIIDTFSHYRFTILPS